MKITIRLRRPARIGLKWGVTKFVQCYRCAKLPHSRCRHEKPRPLGLALLSIAWLRVTAMWRGR